MPKYIVRIIYETEQIEADNPNNAYHKFWEEIYPNDKLIWDFIDENTSIAEVPDKINDKKMGQELLRDDLDYLEKAIKYLKKQNKTKSTNEKNNKRPRKNNNRSK